MRVYTFGDGEAEGDGDMVDALGAKGAGLAAMTRLGVPVPPGFTLPTDACRAFLAEGDAALTRIWGEVERGLTHVERLTGRRFGDPAHPLLVSVRSGAAFSMPGIMDTLLNVGLNDETREGLAARSGRPRFALDCQRRLMEMMSEAGEAAEIAALDEVREEVCQLSGVRGIEALPEPQLAGLITAYQRRLQALDASVPDAPRAQLRAAIIAVFRSWQSRRARRFRAQAGVDDSGGTAVTVQAMVFGNLGPRSATGVAFSRDPNSGERRLFGEYLPEAQGEDVVSGAHTPRALSRADASVDGEALEDADPAAFQTLSEIAGRLEAALLDVQDIEFTIEEGRVWLLQTRKAHRSVRASVRFAVEMVDEGLIDRGDALLRVEPERLTTLLHPSVDLHTQRKIIARGLPASPGAVSGVVVFSPTEAIARAEAGESVILVRVETSTDDLEAIRASAGVLTARGGMTSHAALVARGIGRCCVTGCSDLVIDELHGRFTVRQRAIVVEAGASITLDGSRGEVMLGEVATRPAEPPEAFGRLMTWADEARTLGVFSNADSATEARLAHENGADGVGLVRTEHMFLGEDRVTLVRELVFADELDRRRAVVDRMLPIQRADFEAIFVEVGSRPVAIRLLDLPLYDVVSGDEGALVAVASALNLSVGTVHARVRQLSAANPLLGHRGCRLGLTFPEVYEVQVRAAFEAHQAAGARCELQIVVPLVTCGEEMTRMRRRVEQTAARVAEEHGGGPIRFTLGAMIESPRACLVADEIAASADFFLFGANDLTTATFCLNRDDAGRYLPFYLEHGVLESDPFVTLDRAVCALIEMAIARGRGARSGLRCGLGGAQASEPSTADFAVRAGLDYLTCAPHHVPVARLAAAQCAVRAGAVS